MMDRVPTYINHPSDAFFVATEYTLPILSFAASIATFRHAALPK